MCIKLTGMKETLFDIAVLLISEGDYDSINMRQIAEKAGITAASIYNHFSSKQDILDTIYRYYREHFHDNLKSTEEIKAIIERGTKEEIMNCFAFTFESEDKKKYQRMVLISKIIYLRLIKDAVANDIFQNLMTKQPEKMMKELLDYGIEIGRFKPFDTEIFAAILNSYRHIMGIKAFSGPEYYVHQLEEEAKAIAMIGELLPFNESIIEFR